MPQIGFTDKQAEVYRRFNALRRAYEDANGGGRVYNPDFLTVLMDAWEQREVVLFHKIVGQYLSNMAYDGTALYEYTAWLSQNINDSMRFQSSEKAIEYLKKCEQEINEWSVLDFVDEKSKNK